MAGKPRVVPTARLQKRINAQAPMDTTGMDPAMKATLTQERQRKGIFSNLFAPFAKAAAKPAGKKAKK